MPICVREQGFTLIETLIATTVFSVGMLGAAGLTAVVIRGHALSRHMTSATVLAQDKLESVYATAYTDISNAYDVITTDDRQQYIRTVDVAADIPTAGMKTVAITVRWARSDVPDHQVVLKTIVFENGM